MLKIFQISKYIYLFYKILENNFKKLLSESTLSQLF